MNEFKRNKILEKHQTLNLKNKKKKLDEFVNNTFAISKRFSEQEAKQAISEFITKIKKMDPHKADERQQLLKALEGINDKFKLKLPLGHSNGRQINSVKR